MRRDSDLINEILANFDFEKVKTVMWALKWTYADTYGGGAYEPGYTDLMSTARYVLEQAVEQAKQSTQHHEIGWICATGGFRATAYRDKFALGRVKYLNLDFIPVEYDVENYTNENR